MMIQSLKSLRAALLLSASAAATTPVLAHVQAQVRPDGVSQTANALSLELVAAADGAAVSVVDHNDYDYGVKQMSGKLTVLNGTDKSEAELKPAGGDRQEAGGVKLGTGARAVAAVTEGRRTNTIPFTFE